MLVILIVNNKQGHVIYRVKLWCVYRSSRPFENSQFDSKINCFYTIFKGVISHAMGKMVPVSIYARATKRTKNLSKNFL
jgi:hypothetical protein